MTAYFTHFPLNLIKLHNHLLCEDVNNWVDLVLPSSCRDLKIIEFLSIWRTGSLNLGEMGSIAVLRLCRLYLLQNYSKIWLFLCCWDLPRNLHEIVAIIITGKNWILYRRLLGRDLLFPFRHYRCQVWMSTNVLAELGSWLDLLHSGILKIQRSQRKPLTLVVLELSSFLCDAFNLESYWVIDALVQLKLVSDKDRPKTESSQVWKASVPDLV